MLDHVRRLVARCGGSTRRDLVAREPQGQRFLPLPYATPVGHVLQGTSRRTGRPRASAERGDHFAGGEGQLMAYNDDDLNWVYDRSDGTCFYCDKQLAFVNYGIVGARDAWEVDHFIPVASDGAHHPS